MASPATIAMYGHRLGVFAKGSSGSEIWVDRVQRVEPTQTLRTTPSYELGTVGKVGITQDPAEYRVVLEDNLHNCELDFCLAGKNPAPAGAQSYHLGDLLGKANTMYVLGRNDAGTIDKELEVSGCRIAEVAFAFSIRDAIKETWTLEGTASKWYTSGFPHSAWGTPDTTAPGSVHGKEARIWFTSGSAATSQQFRLQSFNIRAAFPNEQVKELGNRSVVGTLSDSPDVNLDFDVLTTDDQPLDKLFVSSGSGWDLNQPAAVFNGFVRVFDPDQSEAASVIKMFKVENLRVTGSTPTRAQARGLATMHYTMTVTKETTVSSGGLIISNRNDLT